MSYSQDLSKELSVANSLEAASRSGAVDGTAVDCQGYDGILLDLRVGTITTGPIAAEWQESDSSGSGFTAIAAANLAGGGLIPSLTTSNDNGSFIRSYIGSKRYVRFSVTAVTGSGLLCADVVRGIANRAPVTQG